MGFSNVCEELFMFFFLTISIFHHGPSKSLFWPTVVDLKSFQTDIRVQPHRMALMWKGLWHLFHITFLFCVFWGTLEKVIKFQAKIMPFR